MSYVKSVPLKKLFQYTQDDDEVVLLASTNEQPEDAEQLKNAIGADTVDNTTVNAAIEEDPVATRAILGFGDSVFYAADFGVLADGTTDDTDALQSAISAAHAVASSSAPASVVLPSGTIMVRKTSLSGAIPDVAPDRACVILVSNVNLYGQGVDATVIKALNSVPNNVSVVGASASGTYGASNIRLRGFTVHGNKVGRGLDPYISANEAEGVNFKDASDVFVSDLNVVEVGADAMDLDGCSDSVFSGIKIMNVLGSGFHIGNYISGSNNVTIQNCYFENVGFGRAALTWADPSATLIFGAGIDWDANVLNLNIRNCDFVDCAMSMCSNGGSAVAADCRSIRSTSTGYPSIFVGKSSGSFSLFGSQIHSLNDQGVLMDYGNGGFKAIDCLIYVTAGQSSAVRVVQGTANIINSTLAGNYVVHVSSGATAEISGTRFTYYAQAVRAEDGSAGSVKQCDFVVGGGYTAINLRGGALWRLERNSFASGAIVSGLSTASATILGNYGGFALSLAGPNSKVRDNEISNLTFSAGTATGNTIERNGISGTVSHTTANYGSNAWNDNNGTGVSGVFSGAVTLTAGTATISTAAAYSTKKFLLTRQAANGSTAIGSLALGTITAGTSFVINSLKSDATVETGDASTVYWEIVE